MPEPEPVVDPPRFRDHIDVINTPEMIEKLAEADINGPKAFIKADAEHIARVTGLTLVTVKEAQSRLDGMRHLLPGLRF